MAHIGVDEAIPNWGVWGTLQHVLEDTLSGSTVTGYGAAPTASGAVNTAAMQAALNDAGTVTVPPGVYNLDTAGANPYDGTHQYCLEVPANTTLFLAPGATLQLADGQQTDAGGAVDIVVAGAVAGVTIAGSGTISGNTAGQTGWTGGYQQITAGCIIRVDGGASDLVVEGVTLRDHWSNPVFVSGDIADRAQRVRLEGLTVIDCGEGLLLERTDYSWVDDCLVWDESTVFVGDGIEFSDCQYFSSTGAVLIGPGFGAGFDIFGSSNGVISNFKIDGWNSGVSIDDGTTGSDNVAVSDGVATGCADASGAFQVAGTATTQVGFQNVHARGATGPGFQTSNGLPGPTVFEGCTAKGCQDGLIITTAAGVTVVGCSFSENTRDGIIWAGLAGASSAADTANLFITSNSCYGNGRFGILVEDNGGVAVNLPTGGITNNMLLNNATNNYVAQGVADSNLTVSGNITS